MNMSHGFMYDYIVNIRGIMHYELMFMDIAHISTEQLDIGDKIMNKKHTTSYDI